MENQDYVVLHEKLFEKIFDFCLVDFENLFMFFGIFNYLEMSVMQREHLNRHKN